MEAKNITVPEDAIPMLLRHRTHYRQSTAAEQYSAELVATFGQILPHLPPDITSITDVGCGLAGIDVLLYHHYEQPDIHLVDYDGISDGPQGGYHTRAGQFAHYNSFELTRQLLEANGVPPEKIIIHDLRRDPFPPGHHPLIISLLSWGFHYPVTTYRPDFGTLIMDVRRGSPGAAVLASWGSCQVVHEHGKYQRIICTKRIKP